MGTLKLFVKWTILVWLNVIFSFIAAVSEGFDSLPEVLGISLAVFTFVGIYSFIDFCFMQRGKDSLRKWLLISVIVKAFTQLLPWLQLVTGILSLLCIERMLVVLSQLFGMEPVKEAALSKVDSFFIPYFTTLINGVILSIGVAIILFIIKLIVSKLIPLFRTKKPLNKTA